MLPMTSILAIDSSTEACSCAITLDGEISERFEFIPRGHTRHILPMIQSLMQDAGLGYDDLDALAVGAGPGSFTGLRIAAGVAQGIAFGASLPLIPVSTLACMAYQAQGQGFDHILTCLDARINEVYWAVYNCAGGIVAVDGDEQLSTPERVVLNEGSDYLALGNGMQFQTQMPIPTQNLIKAVNAEIYPRAAAIAHLGAEYFAAGKTLEPAAFSPTYLRNQVTRI